MSEPTTKASHIELVIPGVRHWSVHDDRIDYRSDAYAVDADGGTVLVDPLPLTDAALITLGRVEAICLTIQSHGRSSWRLRQRLGARVYAPRAAAGLEEEPDVWYGDGDMLPGGLRALHAPGPCEASYALHLEPVAGPGVLFLGDLLTGDRTLRFVEDQWQDDPARTRGSVRALLGLRADVVCPGHGEPLREGGTEALRRALETDAKRG